MFSVRFALVVMFAAAASAVRKVDCTHAEISANATVEGWYFDTLFPSFEDSKSRVAKQTLTFESLAGLATVGSGFADLMEFLVTAKQFESEVAPPSVTVDEIQQLWRDRWSGLGSTTLAMAAKDEANGLVTSAASGFARASTYLLVAERFMNHTSPQGLMLFNQSVMAFQKSLDLTGGRPPNQGPGGPTCRVVSIPYSDSAGDETTRVGATVPLHGYWCAPYGAFSSVILGMTGYDGTAEMMVQSVGFATARRGYGVLLFEGPGQGSVARFQGLTFRPDWEVVVDQVAAWAVSSLGVSPSSLAVWGRSFGGYLSARAFAAGSTPFRALIADGGIADFYQTFVCALPESLQELWYSDQAAFEEQMEGATEVSLSLRLFKNFGTLGFGTTTFAELYTVLQNYSVVAPLPSTGKPVIDGAGSRAVLTMQPGLDLLTGNQSALFFDALPRPLNSSSQLLQLPAMTGAALHCGVGSTSVATGAELDWLEAVLPVA